VEGSSFRDSVEARLKLYQKHAAGATIKAYINVGGGTVSTGRAAGKKLFHPGLNREPTSAMYDIDGVMPRFVTQGVPVIHLTQVLELAGRFGMPRNLTRVPQLGAANVFVGTDYNVYLVWTALAVIGLSLYGFMRSDVGVRLLRPAIEGRERSYLEPSV
jgi:hypothetical protein